MTDYSTTAQTRTAFDSMASEYDADFTDTVIGRLMREAVWRRLDARYKAGDRVLELNCGTGEDACHLAERGVRILATDASCEMVSATRAKAELRGLGARVETRAMAIEEIGVMAWDEGLFDGAISNFGGLNCVPDLREAGGNLARCMRPGGAFLASVMGPAVPWEWGWYVCRGRPGKAFRRLRPGGVAWNGMAVRYPGIGRLKRALAPMFRLERACAIGALVPPPYANGWAERHPGLINALNRLERRLETAWPLPLLADHYLAEFVRT